ncbi:hypothetical protein LOY90_004518, partial [Ophidiomyces ophidiicola]
MSSIPSPEELEHFQRLSNSYEPDLQGPLVGPRMSTNAIVNEYAQGHPIYVAKTSALAATHSHYRTMKGDGNCGWRALSFGYFEALLRLRDARKIAEEIVRLKGFNRLIAASGHAEDLFEMFVDASVSLLEAMLKAIGSENYDDSVLMDVYNDEYTSTSIIQHFRLITSAWMRLHRDQYQSFLPEPLDQYCQRTIETVKTEIDEIGLQGLVDGVISDSGFAVQIAYLDRSQGDQVNFHVLTPGGPSLATIRLLYRPGHYDVLYPTDPNQLDVPVNFQFGLTYSSSSWCSAGLPFDINSALISIPAVSIEDQYFRPMPVNPHFHPPMAVNPLAYEE